MPDGVVPEMSDFYPKPSGNTELDAALKLAFEYVYQLRDNARNAERLLKQLQAAPRYDPLAVQTLLTTIPGFDFFQSGVSRSVYSGQGSVLPVVSGGFTYDNSVAGQIIWSWAGLQVLPPHLAAQPQNYIAIPDGSQTITGLTAGHTVYFYPRYPVSGVPRTGPLVGAVSGLIEWCAPAGSGAVGTPAIGYDTTRNAVAAQAQVQDGYQPLSAGAMSAAVTGGGGGGGGGGGSGCLRHDMIAEKRGTGEVPLHDLRSGDWIRGRRDWTQVVATRDSLQGPLVLAQFKAGQWTDFIAGSVTHPMPVAGETAAQTLTLEAVNAAALYLGRTGTREHPITLAAMLILEGKWKCRSLTCYPEHEFYAGAHHACILNHNNVAPK